MKAKQIEKLLTGVMTNFLESIKDEEIKKIIKENSFITGGCIPSMLMDEWINDYDLYFYCKNDTEKVKQYFEEKHTTDKKDKYHVKLITENSTNLSDKIQLITKFIGDPMFITQQFDWQHIKSWYSCKEEKLYLTNDVYRLIVEKELIYTGSAYPLSSFLRLKKYLKKGWNVSTATMVHIALDITQSFRNSDAHRIRKQLQNANISPELLDDFQQENENQTEPEFFVDDIIYHLNGVDPLTVQAELEKKKGIYLPLSEIIEMIER